MEWTQVDIFTTTAGIDPLCAALSDCGIGGFAIADAADFELFLDHKQGHWDYIDEDVMKLRGAETKVTVYLPCNSQGQEQLVVVRQALARLKEMDSDKEWGRLELAMESLKEEDWAFGWKKYYVPTPVGKNLVVCPSWEDFAPEKNQVVLRMDPGMAFGTGTHDSTRMCMALAEKVVAKDATVLDLGCGSGILSVTALLLGAKSALGVDLDEVAVQVSEENAQLNGVEEKARFLKGDLTDKVSGKFDVIFANIVADIIISLCPDLLRYLAQDGWFITSGIIDTRAEDVKTAIEAAGLVVVETMENGGWVAFCCKEAR